MQVGAEDSTGPRTLGARSQRIADAGLSDRIEPPPEVARTWHFVARAALPSRAPSLA